MKVINLTPHSVKVFSHNGHIINEFHSEGCLRLGTSKSLVKDHELSEVYPTYRVERKKIDPKMLPPIVAGTYYIVAAMVQEAHPERLDFIAPNTSADSVGAVRDNKGVIIGVKSFILN